jgi:hypothetical protein
MRVRTLLVAGLVVVGMVGAIMPASATITGEEGCTPGFWKNHTEYWLEEPGVPSYPTDALFGEIFGVDYGDVTLLEALQGGGGGGLAGAQKILARAATAAILNAASEDLGYPLRRAVIIPAVQAAWDDRGEALDLAKYLDGLNNLGTDDFC